MKFVLEQRLHDSYLYKLFFQGFIVSMVDVNSSSVVILKWRTYHNVIFPIKVEVRHSCYGSTKPSSAWLIFNGTASRLGNTTRLVDRLQGKLVLKLALMAIKPRNIKIVRDNIQ